MAGLAPQEHDVTIQRLIEVYQERLYFFLKK
jgi:hypothetical protein